MANASRRGSVGPSRWRTESSPHEVDRYEVKFPRCVVGNCAAAASAIVTSQRQEAFLATYVLLSTLTPSGGSTLHTHPHRLKEVNKEITELGCKVISQYALLGPYDFLTVVEAPDNETIAHLSVDLGSRGSVKVMSLPAIAIDSLVT